MARALPCRQVGMAGLPTIMSEELHSAVVMNNGEVVHPQTRLEQHQVPHSRAAKQVVCGALGSCAVRV